MAQEPKIAVAGDRAVLVEFPGGVSPQTNRQVRGMARALEENPFPGLLEVLPSYRSLLVVYDPLAIDLKTLNQKLTERAVAIETTELPPHRTVEIPTVYGGEFGPDLLDVAEYNNLTPAEVVKIHSRQTYLVYCLGFAPGFPFLGGMSPRIAMPRLDNPRRKVPAGSVGIGGHQTGIYPLETPGGWRLIGRTPVHLYLPQEDPPVLLQAGDHLRFVPVSQEEYYRISRAVAAGRYRVKITTFIPGTKMSRRRPSLAASRSP